MAVKSISVPSTPQRNPNRSTARSVASSTNSSPEIFHCEQGEDEWHELRRGIPTASNFATVMASGKNDGPSLGRRDYMYRLAGEILTGVPAETFRSKAMERGNEMEPRARQHYQRMNFVELNRVGFVRRKLPSGRWVGCSPDSLIGKRKGLEIKTMKPELMIALLERGGGMPSDHRAQVHGTCWVADLDEVDLMLFYDGMPVAPKWTVRRDETFIKEISDAVEVFDHELNRLVEKLRGMGVPR